MSSTTFPPDVLKRAVLGAVNSKNRAEVQRIAVTRRRFAAHVLDDPRTRDVFARWRHDSRLDLVITAWAAQLDVAAQRVGVAHRSALAHDAAIFDALPLVARRFFADCDRLFTLRYGRSVDARAADALHFIDRTLYTEPPRLRAWLGLLLLDVFQAEAIGDVWGVSQAATILCGSLIPLPEKHGYTPDDEKLERGADWYYRSEVASPKATHAQIAREYAAAQEAAGVNLAPKDRDGIREVADTKLVRDRIKEADRLLNRLALSPNDALRFLATNTQKPH